MRLHRRQRQQYIFAGAIAAIAAISILFFLILYLPARVDYRRLVNSIERLERETGERRSNLERLEAIDRELDEARTERLRFMAARLIPREEGFAAMLPDLERLAALAGIDRNRVQYAIEPQPQFGVYSVRINLPVRGDYSAVTRFIRELERSETLFILDAIALRHSQGGESGLLDLSLNLTTYFAYDR